jgi:hypothetical protein
LRLLAPETVSTRALNLLAGALRRHRGTAVLALRAVLSPQAVDDRLSLGITLGITRPRPPLLPAP